MNGQGLYRFKKTGDVFDGTFVDGLKEGKGKDVMSFITLMRLHTYILNVWKSLPDGGII